MGKCKIRGIRFQNDEGVAVGRFQALSRFAGTLIRRTGGTDKLRSNRPKAPKGLKFKKKSR